MFLELFNSLTFSLREEILFKTQTYNWGRDSSVYRMTTL
jgi:hypothetical protein